jgi:hypothetical protein
VRRHGEDDSECVDDEDDAVHLAEVRDVSLKERL